MSTHTLGELMTGPVRGGRPVRLSAEAHGQLQRETLRLGADLGRRLSMGDAMLSALRVAGRHRAEWLAELGAGVASEGGPE
jgi:hypothetical protein